MILRFVCDCIRFLAYRVAEFDSPHELLNGDSMFAQMVGELPDYEQDALRLAATKARCHRFQLTEI